jgi:hypothetical protein
MISMTFTGSPFLKSCRFLQSRPRQNRRVDSEQFRFIPRACPSVWWQADCVEGGGPLPPTLDARRRVAATSASWVALGKRQICSTIKDGGLGR